MGSWGYNGPRCLGVLPPAPPLPGPAPASAEQWKKTRAQLQDERREFLVLVRYLFTRHGVQISVPAERLAQVKRRLLDLQDGLTKWQGYRAQWADFYA
jgi:hypothetical protein